jgi:hypothetical protein
MKSIEGYDDLIMVLISAGTVETISSLMTIESVRNLEIMNQINKNYSPILEIKSMLNP